MTGAGSDDPRRGGDYRRSDSRPPAPRSKPWTRAMPSIRRSRGRSWRPGFMPRPLPVEVGWWRSRAGRDRADPRGDRRHRWRDGARSRDAPARHRRGGAGRRSGRPSRATACSVPSSTRARWSTRRRPRRAAGRRPVARSRARSPRRCDGGAAWRHHRGEDVDDVAAGASVRAGQRPAGWPRATRPIVANFLVDLESPGVERLPGFDALGMRGSASGRLRLTDVEVPAESLVVRRPAGSPGSARVRRRRPGSRSRSRRSTSGSARALARRSPAGPSIGDPATDRRPSRTSRRSSFGSAGWTPRSACRAHRPRGRRDDAGTPPRTTGSRPRIERRPHARQARRHERRRHRDRGGAAHRGWSRVPRRTPGTRLPRRPGRPHQPAARRRRVDRVRTRRAGATPVDSLA